MLLQHCTHRHLGIKERIISLPRRAAWASSLYPAAAWLHKRTPACMGAKSSCATLFQAWKVSCWSRISMTQIRTTQDGLWRLHGHSYATTFSDPRKSTRRLAPSSLGRRAARRQVLRQRRCMPSSPMTALRLRSRGRAATRSIEALERSRTVKDEARAHRTRDGADALRTVSVPGVSRSNVANQRTIVAGRFRPSLAGGEPPSREHLCPVPVARRQLRCANSNHLSQPHPHKYI